ncbi:MAG: ABC transporter permease [Eubacteriales bacterium]|nr:ABC transporter permease [Eubacteriales bacterium]
MWKFVVKRLLLTIPIIIAVIFVVFTLLHFAPGDITMQLLGTKWTPEAAETLRHELGIDQPFMTQFINYIKGIVQGNFGISYISRESVTNMLAVSMPNTIYILITSVVLSIVISIPIGILAALKPNSVFSGITTAFSLIGVSAPSFWIGLLLILLLSLRLKWLPASGLESFSALIMPSVVMSLSHLAALSRTTRSSMIESLRMDYIRTARAKGVKKKDIVLKHALRNALMPTVSLVGFIIGEMIGGATVVETIFGISGMGRLLVESVNKRDINVVLGCVTMMAICVAVISIVTDVAFAYLDPRIKAQYVSGGKSNG